MVCIKKTKRQDRGDERLENIINRLLLLFFSPRTVALVWAVRVVTALWKKAPTSSALRSARQGVLGEKLRCSGRFSFGFFITLLYSFHINLQQFTAHHFTVGFSAA